MTGYMVGVASRVMGVPVRDFLVLRGSDVARVRHEAVRVVARVRRRSTT
jgi:hypothetical protein